jgi:hypothetical protein
MTFEDFERKFPNGLDDAEIFSMSLDYQYRRAKVELTLRANPPESPDRDQYQRAVLLLKGFYYFVIEPPDADHLWYPHRPIQVDGFPEDGSEFSPFDNLKSKLPADAFCCRFYVHDWNSFIHVAARDAQFSWATDGASLNPFVSAP